MQVKTGSGLFDEKIEIYAHTFTEIEAKSLPHKHDFLEIAYVTKGSGNHHISSNHYPITAGDIFVINSFVEHHFSSINNLTIRYLILGLHFMEKTMDRLRDIPGFFEFFLVEPAFRLETHFSQRLHLNREVVGKVDPLFTKIEKECHAKRAGYEVMLEALTWELFVTLSRLYSGYSQQHLNTEELISKRQSIEKVLNYLDTHSDEPIKLSALARYSCLQSEYLCRVFKKCMGLTIIEYLTQVRIKNACEQLLQSDKSISDICYIVGFNDLSHFSRTFRKIIGLSPSEYRKNKSNASS